MFLVWSCLVWYRSSQVRSRFHPIRFPPSAKITFFTNSALAYCKNYSTGYQQLRGLFIATTISLLRTRPPLLSRCALCARHFSPGPSPSILRSVAVRLLPFGLAFFSARCEPVDSPFRCCISASLRARVFLRPVRARRFPVLSLFFRFPSGSRFSPPGASPMFRYSAAVWIPSVGLAPVCEKPEPVAPSSGLCQSIVSWAHGSFFFVCVVGGVGRLSPASASAVKDNREICQWLFTVVINRPNRLWLWRLSPVCAAGSS